MSDFLKPKMDFIREAERLKSTERTAWTACGRRESTAEHSWRLALLAGILTEDFPQADHSKVLMMCLIHDLGELYNGDISAALLPDPNEKYSGEHEDANRIFSLLPEHQFSWLSGLWEEYSQGITPEARLVKALDKAETILQHNQGENPPDFDYAFNLDYGKHYFETDELLQTLREILDEETKRRLNQ